MKTREPGTASEWQHAVNLAEFWIRVHAARCYGLVKCGAEIDVDRCQAILDKGRRRGVHPDLEAVDEFARAAGR